MSWLKIVFFLLALVLGGASGFVFYQGGFPGDSKDGSHGSQGIHGAPGPLAGVGLPVLAVGYGVYWLVRRRRRKTD